MTYVLPRRGRLVAAAALSIVVFFALAVTQALADGEDDPTFGNVGTAFVPLGEQSTAGDPKTDQGADGSVVTAVGVRGDEQPRGGGDAVRVVRMNASGTPAGLDGDGIVDVPLGVVYDVLDVEALADGRIVVVVRGGRQPSRGSGSSLAVVTLNGAGAVVSTYLDPPPEECWNGSPVAADVDAAGRVFVAWDFCSASEARGDNYDSVLVRYIGDDEEKVLDNLAFSDIVALVLGPDGNVYLLARGGYFGNPNLRRAAEARGGGFFSVVGRASTDLDYDENYGEEEPGAFVPGWPLDLTVDPKGRAVAWTAGQTIVGRGTDEGSVWDFFRLDTAGDPDESFDGDGHAGIVHPDLGSICPFCRLPGLVAQADSKIVAVGPAPWEGEKGMEFRGAGEGPDRSERDRTIARLTEDGKLDPTWDGDGVRTFSLGQPPEGGATYWSVGPPVLQSDGKLLLPSLTFSGEQQVERVPTPPDDMALGVSRIGLTPVTQTQQQQQAATTTTAASRSCVSRRVFRIRLRTGRKRAERSAIKTVTVTVNGKPVPVNKGARRTAQVNLRNLPKGRFTVVIRMTLADGGKVRDTRRYRTCTPKQARELPALRTRAPKSKRRR